MRVNYKNIEVTSLEERDLFEAEFNDLSSPFTDDRYYAVFTVNADNSSIPVYVTERIDGVSVQVEEESILAEIKRVIDTWLKHNAATIEKLSAA